MPNSPPTFRRSIGRYRRRAVAVFALGLIAAAGLAANWPNSSYSEAPSAASLTAAADAPLPPQAEDKSASQRADLARHQAELQSKLADLDARLQQHESLLNSTDGKIASLTAMLAEPAEPTTAPAKLGANFLPPPPPPVDLRQQLDALRSREHQLAAKMRNNHPQLLALRQQIADLQASQPELPHQPAGSKAPTPAPEPLAAAMLAAERTRAEKLAIEGRSLLAARDALRRQLAEIHSHLAAVIAEPERAVADLPATSATQQAVADAPRIRATVPQPASFSTAALPSRRALILAPGVLAAALLALVTALVSAARNPLLCRAQQLETLWDIPLAGTVPPDLRLMPSAS